MYFVNANCVMQLLVKCHVSRDWLLWFLSGAHVRRQTPEQMVLQWFSVVKLVLFNDFSVVQ